MGALGQPMTTVAWANCSGVAVLSIHPLWEVTNKADVYEAYKGYKAFIARA